MNLRFRGICTTPVLLVFALLVFALFAAHSASAQDITPPPIKMGLWQNEATVTMTGMENSPMGARMAGNHTSVHQSCLTPETWQSDLAKMREHQAECTRTNLHQDAHSLTFDESCNSGRITTTVHFEATFEGGEHMHGIATARSSGPDLPQGMTMSIHMSAHYLSADCGDVKPGETKMIHQ